MSQYFSSSYEESREKFLNLLSEVKRFYPKAELLTHSIGDENIDVILGEPKRERKAMILMTIGEHGIEGYAGAAVTHQFVQTQLAHVRHETTGICLIHAVNPWGMKHFRRVNEHNVDLNRNYVIDREAVPYNVNREYELMRHLFVPDGVIDDYHEAREQIYSFLGSGIKLDGFKAMSGAKGMGQYQFPKGVYYGGEEDEPSAIFLKGIQHDLLERYGKVVHLDWHTALGPTNEVTMVISKRDGRTEDELKQAYGLDNVNVYDPDEVLGDSTNHFYYVRDTEYPDKGLVSALFEFGTFGTSTKASIREFLTIILENRLYFEGTKDPEARNSIQNEFMAMFYPENADWREAVLREGAKAVEGYLKGEALWRDT
ncbi:M14 family metallopeptidase [Exiguobacterium profundum]